MQQLLRTTRKDDLNELATTVSMAIERARRLELPTSAYILSMVLLEVSQATKVAARDDIDETVQ
jgi:hypothetical protein